MFEYIKNYLTYKHLLFFFSFVAGWPCVFYLMGWLPHYKVNYYILLGLVAWYGMSRNVINAIPPTIRTMLLMQILTWFIYSLFYIDTSYLTRIFLLLTTMFLLGIQSKSDEILAFAKTYNIWLTFQVIAGFVGFILVIAGVLTPIFRFAEMDGRPGYCFGLFATNTYMGGLIRNAGFYDEPGSLACWGVMALLINKLFINNRKIEYLLLLGLVSTLSIAYWIQLFFYLFFFYKNQRKKLLIPLFCVFLAIKGIASYNEVFDRAIFGRMQYDEKTGSISGDNRSILMKRCWKIFVQSPVLGVGAQNLATNVSAKEGVIAANFFFNWASDGIVGAIVTYLPLLYLFSLGRIDRRYMYTSLILLIGYLQRPYTDTQLLYPLVLYTIALLAYYDVYEPDKLYGVGLHDF